MVCCELKLFLILNSPNPCAPSLRLPPNSAILKMGSYCELSPGHLPIDVLLRLWLFLFPFGSPLVFPAALEYFSPSRHSTLHQLKEFPSSFVRRVASVNFVCILALRFMRSCVWVFFVSPAAFFFCDSCRVFFPSSSLFQQLVTSLF